MGTISTSSAYVIQGQTLQDICNAVKSKTGDSTMPVADIATKISGIPVYDFTEMPADVIFIDYDGSVIEAYSKAEYLQKSAATSQGYNTYYVPTPPTHTGLTFEAWNFPSDTEIGAYINGIGCAVIGALYKTTDDKTKVYINIEDADELSLGVQCYKMSSANTITIDWGDSSTVTTDSSSAGLKNWEHTYSALGEYIISISISNPSTTNNFRPGGNSRKFIYNANYSSATVAWTKKVNCVRKIEFASWVGCVYGMAFAYMPNLKTVTLPKEVGGSTSLFPVSATSNAFMGCNSLTGLVIPNPNGTQTTLALGTQTFWGTMSLRYVSIPYGATLSGNQTFIQSSILCVYAYGGSASGSTSIFYICNNSARRVSWGAGTCSSISTNFLYYNESLVKLDFSKMTIATLPGSFAAYNNNLKEVKLPVGLTAVPASMCSYSRSIESLDFSASDIASIAASAFSVCTLCLLYDFTGNTAVPTLANTNAFSGINPNAKILVPSSLVSSWKAASNWSTYASYIVGVESVSIKDMSEVVVDTVKIETGESWGVWVSSSFNKNGYHEEYSSVLGMSVIVNSAGTLVLGVDTTGMGPMMANPVFLSDTVNTNYNYYLVDTIPIN